MSDLTSLCLLVAVVSTAAFGLVLTKHILFKRELVSLKRDMKAHSLRHGIDNALWEMFTTRTREMLRFWK